MEHLINLVSRQKQSNLSIVANFLLEHFGVKFTATQLNKITGDNVGSASLLNLQETLSEYGIKSAGVWKGSLRYSEFQTPFVCSVQYESWSHAEFTVVTEADETSVTFLQPKTKEFQTVSLLEFAKIDNDVILLIDDAEKIDESNFLENSRKEKRRKSVGMLPGYVGLAIFFIGLIYYISHTHFTEGLINGIYMIGGLIGLGVSAMLIWHEIDAHNPLIKKVCGDGNDNVNCDAVLSSSSSTFIGISWSIWGFSYFLALCSIQILFANQPPYILFIRVASLLAAPYIIYSLFYQWQIVKQWCPLCLTVQAVLFVQTIASLISISKLPNTGIDWYFVFVCLVFGAALLLLTSSVVKLIKMVREGISYKIRWRKLKYDAQIFNILLKRNVPIASPADGIGLVLGNRDAKNEIIKVCNPYCGACSDVHSSLKELIRVNPDLKLRIIFTASGDCTDKKTKPVSHFLAIRDEYGQEKLEEALENWYNKKGKNYDEFSAAFPVDTKWDSADSIAEMNTMSVWCDKVGIRATPTIFINGMEMPYSYEVSELRNLF